MPDTYVTTEDKGEFLSAGGGQHFTLVTDDATIAAATSGDLIVYGEMIGIALADYDVDAGAITIDLTGGHTVSVHAYAAAAGEAVDIGDWIYWDTDELNRDSTNGVPVGVALEAIASEGTEDIGVKFWPSPPA